MECSHCTANGRKTDADQQLRQSRRVIFGQRMSLDASPSTERAVCLLEHDASRHCKIGFMSTIANLEGSLVLFPRQQQGASALRDSDMPPSAMARSQAILPPLSARTSTSRSNSAVANRSYTSRLVPFQYHPPYHITLSNGAQPPDQQSSRISTPRQNWYCFDMHGPKYSQALQHRTALLSGFHRHQ